MLRQGKKQYLDYIKKAVLSGRANYQNSIETWKRNFDPHHVFGFSGPGNIPVQAHIEGFMFNVTGEIEYALWAKKCLLDVEQFIELYPKEKIGEHPEYERGLPAVDALFGLQAYICGYLFIKDSDIILEQEKKQIEDTIRRCIYAKLHFPEWGAHNRSMLAVWSLTLAAKAIGPDQETADWEKLAHYLAEESWGKWSIEDAEHYIALWLQACIRYAQITGREQEYYALPSTRYYFDYITHMITPYGQIPDFGDSHFNSNWYIWLACLEKGAAVYRCGFMKYAAQKVWEFGRSLSKDVYSPGIASYLVFAYGDSDDEVQAAVPTWESEEVLEELVGKKMIFRSGWDEDSSYMMLNYRDEGNYGYIPRQYLRTTLSVRAEKMHHGHSDENSIVLLVKNKNILLDDGGYRERLPNGKYRADIYHNRLVFRQGLMKEGQGVYDFIHDEGYYKPATTQKIHFQDFSSLTLSRTRLIDPRLELVWDRIISYLKQEEVFIVVDWICSGKAQDMTVANIWHTGEILSNKENIFDTYIPKMYRGPGDTEPIINRAELSLLIELIGRSEKAKWESIKRGYADSIMISQASSRNYGEGEMDYFITLLTPHPRNRSLESLTGRLRLAYVSDNKDALSLIYRGKEAEVYLAYKLDLNKGLSANEDDYPRYSWERGKLDYKNITTDADFAFVIDSEKALEYGFINGCGLQFKEKELFKTPMFTTYRFGTQIHEKTDNKWRVWNGRILKGGVSL